ncbi:MAG TPA: Ig domain-containing protein [Candidatus Binatia bacterium]|nr:Ig domain-containing protein [Candidatus Binatia bacterium]
MKTMKSEGRMKSSATWSRVVPQLACALGMVALAARPATASTAYGDLNNFDVFNDTGQECHGFEIELDDVHSKDITYTYDYNHYGTPAITEDTTDPLHPKVFVRYAAKYSTGTNTFSAFTAVPTTPPSPTSGHMCTNPAVNQGCEHFGVGYYGAPSVVRYNWLIEDALAPGTLIHGPAVNVATPTWTYYPPAPAQPVAQVQAVILAPPEPVEVPAKEFGDAVWVKSIVTTSHNNAHVELKDLVTDPLVPGDKDWKNNEPDEVEVEWQILQTEFANPAGKNNDLVGAAEDLPNGDEVVTRRYEFYKYAGPLDPETNEASCDNYPPITDPADPKYKPECDLPGGSILGDYIGAQMAGFNVESVLGLIDHVQDGDLNQPYPDRTVVVGGNTPYQTSVTAGALPSGMSIDSATGVLSGTPTAAGLFSFTIEATDADVVHVTKSYTISIVGPPGLCDGVVCTASDQCHDVGVCDPETGLCSDPVKPAGTACEDGDACTVNDRCDANGSCVGAIGGCDHFLCYTAMTTPQTTKFTAVPGVSLVDALATRSVDVDRATQLCAPADKNGEDPTAQTHPDHLMAYHFKTAKAAKVVGIGVTNQFGTLRLDASAPARLLVPAAKSLAAAPSAPVAPTIDHFECYKARKSMGEPKFAKITGVAVTDQLGSYTVDLTAPTQLCNPASKNGESPGAETHAGHLLCYKAVLAKGQPKFATVTPIFVADQFGNLTLDAKKIAELCVPSTIAP